MKRRRPHMITDAAADRAGRAAYTRKVRRLVQEIIREHHNYYECALEPSRNGLAKYLQEVVRRVWT